MRIDLLMRNQADISHIFESILLEELLNFFQELENLLSSELNRSPLRSYDLDGHRQLKVLRGLRTHLSHCNETCPSADREYSRVRGEGAKRQTVDLLSKSKQMVSSSSLTNYRLS